MPVYLGENEINKIYLGSKQIGEAWKGSELLYKAEKMLLGDGTNLLGAPTYNWSGGEGLPLVNDFASQSDGTYLMRMGIATNSWRNWTFNFPNKVKTEDYTTVKLTYTVTNSRGTSRVNFYIGGSYKALNLAAGREHTLTIDVSGKDEVQPYFAGNFGAGGQFCAKIKITLE